MTTNTNIQVSTNANATNDDTVHLIDPESDANQSRPDFSIDVLTLCGRTVRGSKEPGDHLHVGHNAVEHLCENCRRAVNKGRKAGIDATHPALMDLYGQADEWEFQYGDDA